MTTLEGQTASTTIPTLLSAVRETITLKKYKNVKKYSSCLYRASTVSTASTASTVSKHFLLFQLMHTIIKSQEY
jgi:hypothetical protein